MAGKNPKSIRRVLVTAGPTREMLDPVRFISNLSTGEMGYALAREAHRRGLKTTLISGPVALTPPPGVRFVPIVTVEDLRRALKKYFFRHDLLFMSAAVGDFFPAVRAAKKIPRRRNWKVRFRQTPDLVGEVGRKKGDRVVIGFSLETGRWIERSLQKRLKKHLDGIVANYYSDRHVPFGKVSRVHVALIDSRGSQILHLKSKKELAGKLLTWAVRVSKNLKN